MTPNPRALGAAACGVEGSSSPSQRGSSSSSTALASKKLTTTPAISCTVGRKASPFSSIPSRCTSMVWTRDSSLPPLRAPLSFPPHPDDAHVRLQCLRDPSWCVRHPQFRMSLDPRKPSIVPPLGPFRLGLALRGFSSWVLSDRPGNSIYESWYT